MTPGNILWVAGDMWAIVSPSGGIRINHTLGAPRGSTHTQGPTGGPQVSPPSLGHLGRFLGVEGGIFHEASGGPTPAASRSREPCGPAHATRLAVLGQGGGVRSLGPSEGFPAPPTLQACLPHPQTLNPRAAAQGSGWQAVWVAGA
jgi:hypothetical protein